MWESLSRYLGDLPGFDGDAYGEWRYTGDDELRAGLEQN